MGMMNWLRGVKTKATADYQGSSTGRKLVLWNPGAQSINSLIAGNGEMLRNRSRDIVRKDSWASEIVEEWVSNAVGCGIVPKFLHPDLATRKILMEGWKRWCDEADADGQCDFYGLQALACREVIEGGESLSRFRARRASDGLSAPLQIQMLEPEHLPLTKNDLAGNGNRIRAGIEFNGIGQRVAYHLYREHPGAGITALTGTDTSELSRVPAEFMVHCFRVLRSGQYRGEPWLSRALAKLYQLNQFDDATLDRQKLGAMLLGWTSQSDTGNGAFGGSTTLPSGEEAPAGVQYGNLESGSIVSLRPGEEMKFFDNPEVGQQYEAFVTSQLRFIFASAGMSLEQFDVSKVNFSSIRAGIQKFRRRCEQFQFNTLVFQFCRPMLNAWMDAYVLGGNSNINVADYVANRYEYQRVEWRTPKWAWVDPLKDVLAVKEAIRCCLMSRDQAIEELGYDPEDVDASIAAGNARADKLGIVSDSDPRKTADNGQSSTVAAQDNEPPKDQQTEESRMVQ